MGRTFDRCGRVYWNDLADHQVIKEHLDGGQVLLDRLRRSWVLFDIGRNVHGSNRPDVIDVTLGPRQKLSASPCVSFAGIKVSNPRREELEEFCSGVFAGVRQDRRNSVGVAKGQLFILASKIVSDAGALEVHFQVPYRCIIKDVERSRYAESMSGGRER